MTSKKKLYRGLSFVALSALMVTVVLVLVLVLRPSQNEPDRWDQQAQQQTIESAKPLIAAINEYTNTVGSTPTSLEALVPDWIDHIQAPLVGSQEWSYYQTRLGYELTVPGTEEDLPSVFWMILFGSSGFDDTVFTYYPSRDKWELADR